MKIHHAVLGLIVALMGTSVLAENRMAFPVPVEKASRQISVTVTPGLRKTNGLPTSSLRQARRDMLAKKVVSDENLRALANRGDSLAAQKYMRLLVERHRGQPRSASDIAYYGAIAVGAGRVWSLPDMVEALYFLDAETEPKDRIKKYVSVLYPHAWAGNKLALDAVVDFNGQGRLFGNLSETTRKRILAQSEKNGGGRAELRMAINLMQNPNRSEQETEWAREYLKLAMMADNLVIKTAASNLLPLLDASGT
ncbi:MAG: hypothetical protein ACI92Z_001935 [Paracoccaceae bacterium]|jgi:hypothetical protein